MRSSLPEREHEAPARLIARHRNPASRHLPADDRNEGKTINREFQRLPNCPFCLRAPRKLGFVDCFRGGNHRLRSHSQAPSDTLPGHRTANIARQSTDYQSFCEAEPTCCPAASKHGGFLDFPIALLGSSRCASWRRSCRAVPWTCITSRRISGSEPSTQPLKEATHVCQ